MEKYQSRTSIETFQQRNSLLESQSESDVTPPSSGPLVPPAPARVRLKALGALGRSANAPRSVRAPAALLGTRRRIAVKLFWWPCAG